MRISRIPALAVPLLMLLCFSPETVLAQCFKCGQTTCDEGFHAVAGGEGWATSEQGTHGCLPLTCYADGHRTCEETEEDDFAPEDRLALSSLGGQSAESISYLVNKYPASVLWNETRGAIQILGCGESIIAHVPLTAEQAAPFLPKPSDRPVPNPIPIGRNSP